MAKNTKSETIKAYLDEYLQGKSEEKREEFLSKDIDRQYSAIMAWKRRRDIKGETKGLNAADVIKHASSLADLIDMTESFSEKEMAKMHEAIDAAKERLNNFNRMKKSKELRELQRAQEELQRRIDSLRAEGIE